MSNKYKFSDTLNNFGQLLSTDIGNNDLCMQLELYKLVLDHIYDGLVIVDSQGRIIYLNKPYAEFLGIDGDAQTGKHITEVIKNTRMHVVVKTGRPEMNITMNVNGQEVVGNRVPIRKDGKIIAGVGQLTFKHKQDVRKLAEKLSLLESKIKMYEQELISLRSTRYTFNSIVGISKTIINLKNVARKAATTNFPVLITGESGTGKEMFAQAIHNASSQKIYPFVRINCAAIPKELFESELFGYEKGAFTGASSYGKAGKLELANQGTVFFDEIGDLPLEMQPKLLRVLEEKEFERVGGNSPIRSEFRIIAASNQNLEEMINNGNFRKDLFYRLNVIRLHIPPLRERKEDIIPIASQLLGKIVNDLSYEEVRLTPEAERVLQRYDWPGNVRELMNVLERVISSSIKGNTIYPKDLPVHIMYSRVSDKKIRKKDYIGTLRNTRKSAEIEAIKNALIASQYNKSKTATMLGIHRTLLYKKIKTYNIT